MRRLAGDRLGWYPGVAGGSGICAALLLPSARRLRRGFRPPSGTCFHWQFWVLLRLRRTPVGSSVSASRPCRNQGRPIISTHSRALVVDLAGVEPASRTCLRQLVGSRPHDHSLLADESHWCTGGPGTNRTFNLRFWRPVLCQLSYRHGNEKATAWVALGILGVALPSKAGPLCCFARRLTAFVWCRDYPAKICG